jgi:hypothetical protein
MLIARGSSFSDIVAGDAGDETLCETLLPDDFLLELPPPKIIRSERMLGFANLEMLLDLFFLAARVPSVGGGGGPVSDVDLAPAADAADDRAI